MKVRHMIRRTASVVVFMLSILVCKELAEWWEGSNPADDIHETRIRSVPDSHSAPSGLPVEPMHPKRTGSGDDLVVKYRDMEEPIAPNVKHLDQAGAGESGAKVDDLEENKLEEGAEKAKETETGADGGVQEKESEEGGGGGGVAGGAEGAEGGAGGGGEGGGAGGGGEGGAGGGGEGGAGGGAGGGGGDAENEEKDSVESKQQSDPLNSIIEADSSEGDAVVIQPPLPLEHETKDDDEAGKGDIKSKSAPQTDIEKDIKEPVVIQKKISSDSRQLPGFIVDAYEKMSRANMSLNPSIKSQSFPSWINNYYILYVTSETSLDSIDIIPSSNILHFRIKACSDAFIIYAKKYQDISQQSYFVGFSYGSEAQAGIWKQEPNASHDLFPTPPEARLTCDKLVPFLLNYYKGAFQLSLERHLVPFLTWADPNPFDVKYITLSNAVPDQRTLWQFNVNSVQVLRAATGPHYDYEQIWMTTMDRSYAFVAVRACRDVYFFVSDKVGAPSSGGYEVALGIENNTKTAVREKMTGDNKLEVESPGIVDCDAYNTFWLRWSEGKLEVGRGTKLDKRLLIEYAREKHPAAVMSIGLSTGMGATGRWLFKQSDQTAVSSVIL